MSYIYPFRMTSTTATMLCIDPDTMDILIGVRSDNAWVFPGADSLPGGFMEARWTQEHEEGFLGKLTSLLASACRDVFDWVVGDAQRYHEGENSVDCAIRELHEEFNITVTPDQVKLFDVRANARTDTRAHVTNVCYYVELTRRQVADLAPGDDIQEIKRLPIADLHLEMPYAALAAKYPMAFNHFELMMGGLTAWERERHYLDLEGEVISLRAQLAQERERASKERSDTAWAVAGIYGQQGGA